MKKVFWVVLSAALLGGCENANDFAAAQHLEETEITTEYTDFEYENNYENAEFEYKENNNDIFISYPLLSDSSGLNDKINETIKNQALSVLKYYNIENSKDTNISVNYQVYSSDDKIISIVYKGLYSEKSSYPIDLRYTTNINLETGEAVKLSDYADIDKISECLVNSEHYKIIADEEVKNECKGYFVNMEASKFKQILEETDNYEAGSFMPCSFSNFENSADSIVISLPVPHEMGDHVEFLLDKSVILKTVK